MLALVIAAIQVPTAPHVVRGVIRAEDSGEPVAGALVRVLDEDDRTYSDSAGGYVLRLERGGAHRVRVSRTGFEPLVLDVIAGADTTRVDLALSVRALGLPTIAIVGISGDRPTSAQGVSALVPTLGTRSLGRARLKEYGITSEGDPLAALTSFGDVAGRGGSAASLHVRGGSSDQNTVLLDGVPVLNPYHGGGALSSVSPDVVSSVSLHAGVPSARYGGATSGVVALESDTTLPQRITMRGALSESMVRQTVEAPLPYVGGGFTISARRSLAGLLGSDGGAIGSSASFGDVYAKLTHQGAGGHVDAFMLTSGDALAFDARARPTPQPGSLGAGIEPARNRFQWTTRATALSWRSDDSAAVRWAMRGWRTGFSSGAVWAADSGAVSMDAGLTSTGLGISVKRALRAVLLDAGVENEWVASRYAVARLDATSLTDTAARTFATAGQRALTSLFVEGAWSASPRWNFRAGLREQTRDLRWRAPEPRLIARFSPAPRLAFSAGYSRALQDVQSLRNEESLVDAVYGVTLPVISGRRRARQATSDQLTGGVQWQLGDATSIHADAYSRWLRGLVLVPLSTQQPFATAAPVSAGRGTGRGIVASFDHADERLTTQLSYGMGVTERSAGGQRYRPGAGATHSLKAAAGYRVRPRTTVRVALLSEAGRPGNVFAGRMRWAPWSSPDGNADLEGSPQRFVGRLGSRRLRSYARADIGVRHEWVVSPLGLLGTPGNLAAVVGVSNLFARRNAFGLLQETEASPLRTVPMEPRALRVRFEWGR